MSNTGRKSRRRPQRKINQNMKEKLLILFGIVLLLLVILVLRITYINATSGSKYKKQVLSQAQQKYESQVLPAKRGDIYDKNGNILATSNKVYNVILDCKTVNSDEDYVEPTIRALNEVLGIDEETVRSLLADSRTSQSQYQVLTKQLSMDKKKEFEKYKAEDEDSGLTKAQAKERANIKGVWFEEDYLRSYPFNETACDTIGFALDRDVADIGLEGYYNSTLTGVDGRQYGYINDDSDVEQTIIAAVNGKSIQTSIDIGAQQIVEKYVNGFKEAMGAKNIGVIVENPSTGEIIAMDGGDRYDLNNPRDLSAVYTKDEIKEMVADDKWMKNTVLLTTFHSKVDMSDIPFMNSVEFTFVSYDTICIQVNEKKVVGYVEYEGQKVYFDKNGIVLECVDEEQETPAEGEPSDGTASDGTSADGSLTSESLASESVSSDGTASESSTSDGALSADTIKSARVTTTDFQPTLSDVPLVTGLTFDYVTVNKQLPVEKPAVFRTMLALTRMTEKYNITPDSVEFNENSEIILHYYDTVRILLGTDTALEEKMTRVAAILPSLSGLSGELHMEDYKDGDSSFVFSKDV